MTYNMVLEHKMVRVGVRPDCEVYVKPDGTVQPAMMAVIWEVNRICKDRGVEVIFGEPRLESDDYQTNEIYPHARVIHVKDKRDGTVRIVADDAFAVEILAEAWEGLKDRIAMARYAKSRFPEAKDEQLRFYLPESETKWA